jgi:hypothetical protein
MRVLSTLRLTENTSTVGQYDMLLNLDTTFSYM